MQGKIIKGIAGFYYVYGEDEVLYECKAKGIFRKDNQKPLVGDNVEITILDQQEQTGNLIRILPRKNSLIRPAVANVDQAFVIFALENPKPNFMLLDRFLNDAIEVDVDAISDGEQVIIGGIMQHIEQAGVHSGDSACSLPPYSLGAEVQDEIRRQTIAMAKALNVVGLMNVQFAIQGDTIYVLEVNPRASRTVPFVSKVTGQPLAKIAARCMAGITLAAQGVTREVIPPYFAVKEAVFPFIKFPGVDTILGPEMKSTGEVMGVGGSFAEAYVKSQLAAGDRFPKQGKVFLSVRQSDKNGIVEVARDLLDLGFELVATRGTAQMISEQGLPVTAINKVTEGRPHVVDMIKNGEICLVINTVDEKRQAVQDSYSIRRSALQGRIPQYTTLAGARAVCIGMRHLQDLGVYSVQSLHSQL
mgnify:CR=1 FL=1